MVSIPRPESISIVVSEVLASTADHHLGIPFPSLIQSIAGVQVASLLTLIVSVADQNELAVLLQLPDLWLCELNSPELLGDHVMLRLVNSWQVDMKRNCAILLVLSPQFAFKFTVEGRLSGS